MSVPAPQTAQAALAKPPVVSVPAAVVSSAAVTALPVSMAGTSVEIGQPQKATGGQTAVVQRLLKLKHQQQQKAAPLQAAPGPNAQKVNTRQVATRTQQQTSPQRKVRCMPQPSTKTPCVTAPVSQAPKAPVTQQVQGQMQVAKTPPAAQKQTPAENLQQVAATAQQVQAQPQGTCQTSWPIASSGASCSPGGSAQVTAHFLLPSWYLFSCWLSLHLGGDITEQNLLTVVKAPDVCFPPYLQ
ncbi:PREDICTED: E1A-binding protein p400-like isoform X2 [Propithecus coquereli]|uniref:E1A-binding protein p400-like isoform X2 n=1 Tax=Propithecus coquereli TaxID=379532 RepID=UPI00063F276E|nr:PREDICTED: E1A-binding protein p400-like isoform X2 [Propithecus coquereli]